MRPETHWRGFWVQRSMILASLQTKEQEGQWLADLCRQRQQGRFAGLSWLIEAGLIVATHSLTHREVVPAGAPPHLIFAFTPALPGP
jgi:hypothetical protein